MQKSLLVLVTTTVFGCSSGGSTGDLGARDMAGGGGGDRAGGGGGDMAGGGGADLTMMGGPSCGASAVKSPCGDAAVVRATVTLANGMQDKTGTLVLLMNHYRLGSA